jgi:uncharacterized membrane-anchored protein YhcB (DUF1043 family)
MITLIVTFVIGFIVGILVSRNNQTKVNRAVEDAVELYEAAQKEISDLKAKAKKKPAAKKKPVAKKPQVD